MLWNINHIFTSIASCTSLRFAKVKKVKVTVTIISLYKTMSSLKLLYFVFDCYDTEYTFHQHPLLRFTDLAQKVSASFISCTKWQKRSSNFIFNPFVLKLKYYVNNYLILYKFKIYRPSSKFKITLSIMHLSKNDFISLALSYTGSVSRELWVVPVLQSYVKGLCHIYL